MLALKYFEVGALMDSISSFRTRFLYLKDEKKVSLEEIARDINTNKASLSKFVNGKQNIKKDMLEALADYFNVDVAFLLGETNIRRQTEKLSEIYVEVSRAAQNKKVPADTLLKFIELFPDPKEE